MICSQCKYNDGVVYASIPVKYKCTKDNNYYEGNHRCTYGAPRKYIEELHQELVGNLYSVECPNGNIKIEDTPEGIAQVLWYYGYEKRE